MDYVFSSSNKESNYENHDSNHDEDSSLFGQFPWPFLDNISTTEILPNHHQNHVSSEKEPPPSPSKPKRVRKKRSAGKKDRHSKIHTAQGLRDRRMRLSLHIARKFFGLQDMLGFDKASKTIEWLFSKSKKAIEEVTERFKSQKTSQSLSTDRNIEMYQSPLSDCVVDSDIEFNSPSNKGKQPKIEDEMDSGNSNSRKATESDVLARELRDKARARARERTRERMMNNHLEKWKQMFGGIPDDDFEQIQLGFPVNPNNHHMEESSRCHLEYSGTRHFFQVDDIGQKADLGPTAASSSSYFSEFGYNKNFANPPAGWLNSSNTFLGFIGGCDSENFRMESENYGILPNIDSSSTGDIYEQSLRSVVVPHHTDLVHFRSENQKD